MIVPHTIPLAHYLCRHIYMVVSEIVTLLFYIISIAFLPEYFGAFSGNRLTNKPPSSSVLTDLSFVVTVNSCGS